MATQWPSHQWKNFLQLPLGIQVKSLCLRSYRGEYRWFPGPLNCHRGVPPDPSTPLIFPPVICIYVQDISLSIFNYTCVHAFLQKRCQREKALRLNKCIFYFFLGVTTVKCAWISTMTCPGGLPQVQYQFSPIDGVKCQLSSGSIYV